MILLTEGRGEILWALKMLENYLLPGLVNDGISEWIDFKNY